MANADVRRCHVVTACHQYVELWGIPLQGRVLMLNERIRDVADLERALINAERKLKPFADDVRAHLSTETL